MLHSQAELSKVNSNMWTQCNRTKTQVLKKRQIEGVLMYMHGLSWILMRYIWPGSTSLALSRVVSLLSRCMSLARSLFLSLTNTQNRDICAHLHYVVFFVHEYLCMSVYLSARWNGMVIALKAPLTWSNRHTCCVCICQPWLVTLFTPINLWPAYSSLKERVMNEYALSNCSNVF